MVVYGKAYSMGSIILQAADERVLTPSSKVMIHYGEFSATGHPENVRRWFKDNEEFDTWMEQLYLSKIKEKKPRFNLAKLRDMMKHDKIFNADEAVEFGLADKVLGYKG
jgi:ATP-dependent protease ClpP protease subunit